MKKFSLLLLAISGSCFAMTTVNLTTPQYQCNGQYITKQTTVDQLMSNCKNAKQIQHSNVVSGRNPNRIPGGGADITQDNSADNEDSLDKVKFYTDKGSYMICYFNNSSLVKCKANPPKKQPTAKPAASPTQKTTQPPVESK